MQPCQIEVGNLGILCLELASEERTVLCLRDTLTLWGLMQIPVVRVQTQLQDTQMVSAENRRLGWCQEEKTLLGLAEWLFG